MSDIIPQKCCTGCNNLYPATAQYFHRDRYSQDGLYSQCKACKNKKAKVYRDQPEIHEKRMAYMQTYKPVYYSNPEKRNHKNAHDRAYHSRPEIQEHARAQKKVYNETYLQRPEVQLQRLVNKRTRDVRKKSIAGTYTRKQIQDLLKRQKYRCYYCSTKFEQVKGKYLYHIDHTFPVNRVVGTDIPANSIDYLVLACPWCNQSKSDKFPWEWPEGGRLL